MSYPTQDQPYRPPQTAPWPPQGYGQQPPPGPPPGRPPRRRSWMRRHPVLTAISAVTAVIIISVAASSGNHRAQPAANAAAATSAATTPAAAPAQNTPAATAATTITYVVTGTPGAAQVTYGPEGSSLTGKIPMRVKAKLGTAVYYAIQAQLQGGGKVTVKIEINGKIISSGTADGGYNIASAEISQDPLTGKWENTQ